MDSRHPEDFLDKTCHSHGTHVTGILAARRDNAEGISGVANARIMMLKACNDWPGACASAEVKAAIDYATFHDVKIVNCSFGGTDPNGFDVTVQQAISNNPDTLFVFASANYGSNAPTFPCSWPYDNILCVMATDPEGAKWGQTSYHRVSVDLGAPGVNILSTTRRWGNYYAGNCTNVLTQYPPPVPPDIANPNAMYGYISGSSMAAPHVTGTAALVAAQRTAQNPSWVFSPREVKEAILLSAQPTKTLSNVSQLDGTCHTEGLLNADLAVNAYGDSFDDAMNGQAFFSGSSTGQRWGVARNHPNILCNNLIGTVPDSADRAVEAQFRGAPGSTGSFWTSAIFRPNFPPAGTPQIIVLRVSAPDGSYLTGKKGRLNAGLLGRVSESSSSCGGATDVTYSGAIMAGVEMDTGIPFIYVDWPYAEYTYPQEAISFDGVKKISLAIQLQSDGKLAMSITNGSTGEPLFVKTGIQMPAYNFQGSHTPAFAYYGRSNYSSSDEGTLYFRSIASFR